MQKDNFQNNYQILLGKLDQFIRKYYRNRLLKGLIFFAAISLFSFLLVVTLEFFGHFDPLTRTVLFYVFLAANLAVLIYYIIIPGLKIQKFGRTITYEQAAEIIGKYFPQVQDKLLNTLQLNRLYSVSGEEIELLEASISQKTKLLTPVPFASAIDLKKNRKFLKYALPPFGILLLLIFIYPSFITHPTERIIHHSLAYEVPAPFRFVIRNDRLEAFQQEDFTLKVKIEGEYAPGEVFLQTDGSEYKLFRESPVAFSYTFRTLQKSISFRLTDGNIKSAIYELKVYPRPTILNFEAELAYPSYTGRKNEILENTGDLIIPEGTRINWHFFTKDVNKIIMHFPSGNFPLLEKTGNSFNYTSAFNESFKYSIQAFNSYTTAPDSLVFAVTVIPDNYPTIIAEESGDSSMTSWKFFKGVIKDDYGFSRLEFYYNLYPDGDTSRKETKTVNLAFDKTQNQQSFYYSFDVSQILKNPGDAIEYFFQVCDNDGLHGPKCSKTEIFHFRAPTADEVEKMTKQAEKNISSDLENMVKEAQSVQKELEEFNKKLIDKNSLTWQDKKQLQDLLQRENELKDKLDKVRQQNEQKSNLEQQYNQADSSIIEKQKKLNELFDQVMDDETKKMIQDLKDMLDKIDKNQLQNMLDKMKFNNDDLEKQLDRSLELFKQLEFEKNLSQAVEDLKKLSEEQDKLSENTENKDNPKEDLLQKQSELNDRFEELKKDVDDLEKQNKDLDQPNEFPNTDQEQQSISDEMKNSQNSLKENNRKNASKSQKQAAGDINNMAQKLSSLQEDMESEQLGEDTQRLREILENLVRLSFDQEDLMGSTKQVSRNDPRYLTMIQKQNDLKDDLKMVEDSLFQLAKRQVMIKPYIMREINAINTNVGEIVKNLNNRNISAAVAKQQFVMTSVNNLALLLSEVLKEMENQMNMMMSQKEGKNSCNKGGAGGSKLSMKTMRQAQEQLNQQLQKLKKEMEAGQKQGQDKNMKQGNQSMSEQLARLAAQQEAIRNEMKKYQDQMNEEGAKSGKNMNDAMSKMEQTEKDLVNKKILDETLKRQQEILTRLLESEKAEQIRDQEEKRESREAKNPPISNPSEILQYNNMKKQNEGLIKTVQAPFNYFYKNKINDYFLKFEN